MGRPKHDLKLPGGRTMIEAVVAALGEVCARVIVAGDVDVGLPRVVDLRADQGPLGGIEAALASGLDAQYLVCPCDVPLVTGDLLGRLLAPPLPNAVVFRVEGEEGFRPLPARIPADLRGPAGELLDRQRRSVRAFLREAGAEVVSISAAGAARLANVNTMADYEALSRASLSDGA
jgi:molybdopterin-guanine dinucleotide biosynthesis protein A